MLRLINHARTRAACTPSASHARARHRRRSAHSRDMIARDYFAHSSPAARRFDQRARGAGYSHAAAARSWSVGEVIAWGRSCRGHAAAVFKAWMHSSRAPPRSS